MCSSEWTCGICLFLIRELVVRNRRRKEFSLIILCEYFSRNIIEITVNMSAVVAIQCIRTILYDNVHWSITILIILIISFRVLFIALRLKNLGKLSYSLFQSPVNGCGENYLLSFWLVSLLSPMKLLYVHDSSSSCCSVWIHYEK